MVVSWPPNCSINSSSVFAPSSRRRSSPLFSGESSLPFSYLLDCYYHHLLSCLCSLQSNNDKNVVFLLFFDVVVVVVGGADWLICMGLVSSFYFLFFCRYLGQILLRRDSHAGIYIYIYIDRYWFCVCWLKLACLIL